NCLLILSHHNGNEFRIVHSHCLKTYLIIRTTQTTHKNQHEHYRACHMRYKLKKYVGRNNKYSQASADRSSPFLSQQTVHSIQHPLQDPRYGEHLLL
ncbi:unnamed protein product, partial [Amoebophrya sp. A25]